MSLIATTASRHLRRQIVSNASTSTSYNLRIGGGINLPLATRNFTSKNGPNGSSGLRRSQAKGRHATKPRAKSSSSSSTPKPPAAAEAPSYATTDPHLLANEMVNSSSTMSKAARVAGTESVATLTKEQKISNFAMAGGLAAFVGYIFYYSLASVGGDQNAKAFIFGQDTKKEQPVGEGEEESANPGFEEFLKEANEGRSVEEKRLKDESDAKGEARELAELESSTSARLKAEGVEDAVLEGSMSEEEEREMTRAAGFEEGGEEKKKKRPLWKRVVLFWRKD